MSTLSISLKVCRRNFLLLFWEARFLPVKNFEETGGSTGEAGGKLGEARYFWGKHAFCPLKFLEKLGEAIAPSTLFIILK